MCKIKYRIPSWWVTGRAILFGLVLTTYTVSAQEASRGNTTIFGGAQMSLLGNHDFLSGGGGTQPGIINTIRTSPMGILSFSSDANVVTGANDANYVDGYVRKYGNTSFIFPVGDNGKYGPFAASGDGTDGAYYYTNPNSAITSNLGGGNYPILPSGGPFRTDSFVNGLAKVSTVEYWDINGTNATRLSLTWNAASTIAALTGSALSNLTIVGWDGTKWVAIPSLSDATSVLGGTSTLTAGSITTSAAIIPDTYSVYTLATLGTPLPVTLTSFIVTKESQSAQLRWATTSEANSDRFEVEHSLDGKIWNKIGIVASHGESKVLQNYSFADENPTHGGPSHGENLYRLKMVDKDETFAYSRIRNVTFEEGAGIITYPNPVSDKLLVSNYSKVKEVSLSDASGIRRYQKGSISSEGIDVSRLSPGIYIVTLTLFDGTISTHKVAVTK